MKRQFTTRFAQRPSGDMTMSPEMPNAHNYYAWTVACLQPYLGQRVLDIGGGYGAHLDFIIPDRETVLSVDLSESSVQFMRERFAGYPHFDAAQVDFGLDEVQDRLIRQSFDTITCLNVLEHIEDDGAALGQMYHILRPAQGHLLLQVPAHEFLFGSLDELAGHYRRYSRRYLRQVVEGAGFTIKDLFFFNVFGVVPWLINARLVKTQSLASDRVGVQIILFDRFIVPLMRPIERAIRPPAGQSLMLIAQAV